MDKHNNSIQNTFKRWNEVKKVFEESETLESDKYPEMLQVTALLTIASVLEDIFAELKTVEL